ncbi:MAG TPA: DNA invertase, partial [Lachnospiraceae bacterium]|nr:DNA invertase [Lachnospiraceae bacterium]
MGRKSKRLHTLANTADKESNSTGKYYKAGIYARLSVNKGEKNESIDVQVEIAKRFIEEWNEHHSDKIEAVDCYKDLGKTGTSFERDEFKRLMQDVRLGDINCVIVKEDCVKIE